MRTYLQGGHLSWNLMEEPDIGTYDGIVISPVNDSPAEVVARLQPLQKKQGQLDVLFDSQLYNPIAQRGKLPSWGYYSDEVETADTADFKWWSRKSSEVVEQAVSIGATSVCSPALIGKVASDEYFKFIVDVADETQKAATAKGLDAAVTAIVPMSVLNDPKSAPRIASILSGSRCDRIYLNFLADGIELKEPIRDQAGLASAVHLVRLLAANQRVHVACAAHDVILWRGAGATDASSGKYMNVRRFDPSRWSTEKQERGTQVPYWCEDRLLTLIREAEARRLDREGWFANRDFAENPASKKILEIFAEGKGTPWQKFSWVQYLRWFSNTVAITGFTEAESLLATSYNDWAKVKQMQLIFQDGFNDGSHVIAWLNALREGMKR